MNLLNKLKDIILKGDSRSIKTRKNIAASAVIRMVDTAVYLLLVPVTLGYLNSYEYGIWLTLNSILVWIDNFDIGIGNGLRNSLAKSLAEDNKVAARSYVSTAFVIMSALMLIITLIGIVLINVVDLYAIIGTTKEQVPNLLRVTELSFLIFCINFVFKLIGNVYLALQLPAINNLLTLLGHGLALIIIYILTKCTEGSLLWVAIIYTSSPLIVYTITYPITFNVLFKYLSPSVKYFNKSYINVLVNMGVNFFILQIAGIILFSMSSLIISHLFGPQNVTTFNVVYRYYSIVSMLMTIIITPLWSASTDAYVRGDVDWINHAITKINKLLNLVFIVVIVMTLCSKYVILLWVGDSVYAPIGMCVLMGLYIFIIIWSMSYSNILNGMGYLKLQTIMTVIASILFIPLCFVLSNPIGIYGIQITMCLVNGVNAVINTIQLRKILNNRAAGIWAHRNS